MTPTRVCEKRARCVKGIVLMVYPHVYDWKGDTKRDLLLWLLGNTAAQGHWRYEQSEYYPENKMD